MGCVQISIRLSRPYRKALVSAIGQNGVVSTKQTSFQTDVPKFHRLKSALALQRRRFQDFCRAVSVTPVHAKLVMAGERTASARLLAAMRRELGEAAWLFAIGQSDRLPEEGGGNAGR